MMTFKNENLTEDENEDLVATIEKIVKNPNTLDPTMLTNPEKIKSAAYTPQ